MGASVRTRHADDGLALDDQFFHQIERLSLAVRGFSIQGIVGEHKSRRRASSTEFADYRRYVHGDDFRRIDWNAYGRFEGLFLKLTEAKEDRPIHILLDSSRSMDWGHPNKLAYGRRLAAALGYLSLARFDAVTVTPISDTLGEPFPLARGKLQTLRLVNFLRKVPVGGATLLGPTLARYSARVRQNGVALLISDLFTEDDYAGGLRHLLNAGLEVIVLHVLSPEELQPSLAGELELVDVETGETVELTVGEEACRAYRQRILAWRQSIEDFCGASGIGYALVNTGDPLEGLLLRSMRERRIVR